MDDKVFGKRLRGEAWKVFILSMLLMPAQVVFQIVGFLLVLLLNIPDDSLWSSIIVEVFGAASVVAGVALMGGRSWIEPSRDDVRYTFRFGWWCLAVSLGLMVYDLVYYVLDQTPVAADWPLLLGQCALLCLFVGIYEEFLFRGLIFNAFLALMGGTHRGVLAAVLVTSASFGLAHIDTSTDFVDLLSAVQAMLKVIQTGMYSFLLCTIVLRTRKLGGVSLFHAFDDFVLLLPGLVIFGEPFDLDYVVEGESAWPAILNYLIVIALYVPFVVKSLRELHRGQDVYRGVFMEGRIARLEKQCEHMPVEAVGAPVSADGIPDDLTPSQPLSVAGTDRAARDVPPIPKGL